MEISEYQRIIAAYQGANQVAKLLASRQLRVVYAESCTGGLVAGCLSHVSGISNWLCGSSVVYQEQTKVSWLGIDATCIDKFTSTSREMSEAIARQVLTSTGQADFALGVTGHLETNASPQGAYVWCVICSRVELHERVCPSSFYPLKESTRIGRQWAAVEFAHKFTLDWLSEQELSCS
ncbi:MAG TPA: CinA family protein [Pirellulaceae bacterium]|nr:CinA family protein [Pirellulaceae bacterium]HMO92762.1 CinA family protein [Pirellulaceae bacterium]HMP69344.1 CinA family protein [Pirellulaceae bacterium]